MVNSFSDLKADIRVKGLVSASVVKIIRIDQTDEETASIVYKTSEGEHNSLLLPKSDLSKVEIESSAIKPSADGSLFCLVSEAYRIGLAYLFDPYLAVRGSRITPYPHQITAVYERMLPSKPFLRFLLADDPGSGKTIMAGLLIKELIIRGDVDHCLIVVPGVLVDQWQEELTEKFSLDFKVLTSDDFKNKGRINPFDQHNFLIARLDMLSRNKDYIDNIRNAEKEFDLIICDEAHKMSARAYGRKIDKTKRYQFGEVLAEKCRHFLLMTATPHNGIPSSFQLFLSLLDQDRFSLFNMKNKEINIDDMMRRVMKEDLLTFDKKKLLPERVANTLEFELSTKERELYDAVTDYVKNEMNRADQNFKDDLRRHRNIGFALQILQRRLASTPEAIYKSLVRRKEKLQIKLTENKNSRKIIDDIEIDDIEDDDEEEAENIRKIILSATASNKPDELEKEIQILKTLERQALSLVESEEDSKWLALKDTLNKITRENKFGDNNKIIIFSEARDSLNYLTTRIVSHLGDDNAVVVIHGGLTPSQRQERIYSFTNDDKIIVMLANDAAGEGVNLQCASLMVNYDLPWNPNRLEQRFGRIHRIGQKNTCYLWNLVAPETREGQVYKRLLEKIEVISRRFDGRVYNILGELIGQQSLGDMLMAAVRSDVAIDDQHSLGAAFDENAEKILNENCLAYETIKKEDIDKTRNDMWLSAAQKLQPYFIKIFFTSAFKDLKGELKIRGKNRYEITLIPPAVQNFHKKNNFNSLSNIKPKYSRVGFAKEDFSMIKGNNASGDLGLLLAPGEPVFDATRGAFYEKYKDLLLQGAILLDKENFSKDIRFLIYLQHDIENEIPRKDGKGGLVISSKLFFIEFSNIDSDIEMVSGVPYLDYQPLNKDEAVAWSEYPRELPNWEEIEKKAYTYVSNKFVPEHLSEVSTSHLPHLDRIEEEVNNHLGCQEDHLRDVVEKLRDRYNSHSSNLFAKENPLSSGEGGRIAIAQKRLDEISDKKNRRLNQLKSQRSLISRAPRIIGWALIVPNGLMYSLRGIGGQVIDQEARNSIERQAMLAVTEKEKSLGRKVDDRTVSNGKKLRGLGYDLLSRDESGKLYFIEVKGLWKGREQVTLTSNEIGCATNNPDNFRLALVRVGESGVEGIRYISDNLKHTIFGKSGAYQTSSTFSVSKLWNIGKQPC